MSKRAAPATAPLLQEVSVSRTDFAYAELKRRIQSNEYPPGFTALESELALDLQLSRTPVREALIRLREDGYIEIRPRHGVRVLSLSPEDMREIYQVIAGLEAMAVLLLASEGLSPDQLSALDTSVGAMEAAIANGTLDDWSKADKSFHDMLFTFCRNQRLRSLGLSHLARTERARNFTLHLRQKPSISTADHRKLVSMIAARKGPEAQTAVVEHRMRAMEELIRIIEQHRISSF